MCASEDGSQTITRQTALTSWLGNSKEKNPRVKDGSGKSALLNEPNGCWAKTDPKSNEFLGLYIADTGNDCIRFANKNGEVTTLELKGVPDVRETASDCVGGTCKANFDFDEEDDKVGQAAAMKS